MKGKRVFDKSVIYLSFLGLFMETSSMTRTLHSSTLELEHCPWLMQVNDIITKIRPSYTYDIHMYIDEENSFFCVFWVALFQTNLLRLRYSKPINYACAISNLSNLTITLGYSKPNDYACAFPNQTNTFALFQTNQLCFCYAHSLTSIW